MRIQCYLLIALTAFLYSGSLMADPAHVTFVRLERHLKKWVVFVTVDHRDVNWQHFVDRIVVFNENGKRIHTRRIEKPNLIARRFIIRSRIGFRIPPGTKKLIFRAHDRAYGYDGGRSVTVDFTKAKGEGYEIVKKPWNNRFQYFLGEGRFMKTWQRIYAKPRIF